jgi:DNA-binding NtrC family response regulator
MAAPHILVVTNDPETVESVNSVLVECPYNTEAVPLGQPAVDRMYRLPLPELVLLQLGASQSEAPETLKQFLKVRPELKVIILSKIGDSDRVVEAIRMGAHDYITFPFRRPELLQVIRRHVNGREEPDGSMAENIEDVGGGHFFISASPLMRKVRRQAELLSSIDVPVLILGESGTGKEVMARLIHKLSSRSDRRFFKVDCSAPPDELNEIFDNPKRASVNKLEVSNQGTVLLDEVADMSAAFQSKVLHVLQDNQSLTEYGRTNISDARILATTNVDLQRAIGQGRFREDLYYRLSAFTISLPPLRERREGIPVLLRHFMERIAVQYSRVPLAFSPRLMDACQQYTWPGNLRELRNFAKRYLVMEDEKVAMGELSRHQRSKSISVETFPDRPLKVAPASPKPVLTAQEHVRDLKFIVRNVKDEAEIQAINKALDETSWNRKSAAHLLHISYRGLLYKLRRHGITRLSAPKLVARSQEESCPDKAQLSSPSSQRVSNVTVLPSPRDWHR